MQIGSHSRRQKKKKKIKIHIHQLSPKPNPQSFLLFLLHLRSRSHPHPKPLKNSPLHKNKSIKIQMKLPPKNEFPVKHPLLNPFPHPPSDPKQVGGQAVLGIQNILPTPWLTERHGYDPTYHIQSH